MAEYYNDFGDEISESEAYDSYDEMLDDAYGEHMGYSASRIFKEVDPIAYRCGFHDYADSQITDGVWHESDPTVEEDE